MNNLINKRILPTIILALVGISCSAQSSKDISGCVEGILKVDVVRMDNNNHRLFIADKEFKSSDIKVNLPELEKCFNNTAWKSDWSLSVFTEAKFAGYKDEEGIIQYHKGNQWAKSYILEYDHRSKVIVQNPATNPQKTKI